MAYILIKRRSKKGQPYHYLVTSVREGGKVRQRVLVYLGKYPSVEAALEGIPEDIARLRHLAARSQVNMATIRECLGLPLPAPVPRPRREGSQWANRLYSRYWYWARCGEVCEQRVAALSEKLALLQMYRSAHDSVTCETIVGTKPA